MSKFKLKRFKTKISFNFLNFYELKYFYRNKPHFTVKSSGNFEVGSQPPCMSLGPEWCHHEWVFGFVSCCTNHPECQIPSDDDAHLL